MLILISVYFLAMYLIFYLYISEMMINGQEIQKMVLVKVNNPHTMDLLEWTPMASSSLTGML